MSTRARTVLGVVVVVVLVAAVLWLRAADGQTSGPASTTGLDGGVVQQYPPEDRTTPDGFTTTLLDGSTFESQSTRGRVAVYNVWGSWCGPCRKEAPALAKVARDFSGSVAFVGINVRDNAAAATAFERTFDIPYASIHPDESSTPLLAFGEYLAAAAVPSTVVLDPQGRVASRALGALDYKTLRGLVEDAGAVADPTAPSAAETPDAGRPRGAGRAESER